MANRKAEPLEPIIFENEETGEKITIDYDREMVLRMEREGFGGQVISEHFDSMPIDTAVNLLYYGMLKYQPNTTKEQAMNFLFDAVGMSGEFMERLAALYMQPYKALQEASAKNSKWRMKK